MLSVVSIPLNLDPFGAFLPYSKKRALNISLGIFIKVASCHLPQNAQIHKIKKPNFIAFCHLLYPQLLADIY